jgi:hypothetical protein
VAGLAGEDSFGMLRGKGGVPRVNRSGCVEAQGVGEAQGGSRGVGDVGRGESCRSLRCSNWPLPKGEYQKAAGEAWHVAGVWDAKG